MKWFKHWVRASVSDPNISRLQEKFGIVGYAMYFKLVEVIAGELQDKYQDPIVKLSIKRWQQLLMCRRPKLLEFLEVLEEEDHIYVEKDDEYIQVEMPSIRESLDNKAISSSKRGTTGVSEKKKKKSEEKRKITDDPDDFFSLTEDQIDRVRSAISQSGSGAINAVSAVIEAMFAEIGEDDEAFDDVVELVNQQFDKSDSSKALGDSVLSSAKKAYRVTVKKVNAEKQEAMKKKKREAAAKREASSPNKTDKRCIAVMEQLEADSHLDVDEMSINPSELKYFLAKNEEHFGEAYIRRHYGEIIQFLIGLEKEGFDFSSGHEESDKNVFNGGDEYDDDDD